MAEKIEIRASIVLDKRRKKSNGKYPVKIEIYSKVLQRNKYYSIGRPCKETDSLETIDYSSTEFSSIWESLKPRKEYESDRKLLNEYLERAKAVSEKVKPFSFDEFEKKFYQRKIDTIETNIFNLYDDVINELLSENRIGTANSYLCSKNKLMKYSNKDNLDIFQITPQYLKAYEKELLSEGISKTTIGMYLRALRVIFNHAISKGIIELSNYPFSASRNDKNKHSIPKGNNTKKALTKDELKALFYSNPTNEEQQKAKDFFFLSYNCNGMNIADIVNLRYSDIKGEYFHFTREKTKNTNKSNSNEIEVFISDYVKEIIVKYGTEQKHKKQYVFDILKATNTPEQNFKAKKNFVRFINQHLKPLAISVGITDSIGTYHARHSFATNAITEHGASMMFVSKALGHSSLTTTDKYFSGFPDATKKAISESMMNF
jgi:integrase/recombinase XerD